MDGLVFFRAGLGGSCSHRVMAVGDYTYGRNPVEIPSVSTSVLLGPFLLTKNKGTVLRILCREINRL